MHPQHCSLMLSGYPSPGLPCARSQLITTYAVVPVHLHSAVPVQ